MAFNPNLPIHPTTAAAWLDHCREGVEAEMRYALSTHGMPTTDPVRGVANLAEEVGEVAENALEATRKRQLPQPKTVFLSRMVTELNQVAAYAILLRCSMEGEIRKLQEGGQ